MKRRLLNLLTLLSLLVLLSAAGLWVRSYWLEDNVAWVTVTGADTRVDERFRQVFSNRGRIVWRSKVRVLTFEARGGAALQRTTMRDDGPEWAAEPADGRGSSRKDWARGGFGGGVEVERKPARLVLVRSGTDPVPLTGDVTTDRRVAVPHWAVVAVTMAPTVLWLTRRGRRRQRESRRRRGLCPACGYDLRATPGQCPECGAAADTPA